ncbi:unnamed protein product [Rhizoctonia solani]|uniref:DUF1524 domain-containing protein n=1 Tax=Rhizoctonia solani TaxID=456999 RepID=A0A8H3G9J0_9AGAM|nr:unnamed protein product [Rhizoctonia solani]
MTPHSVNAAIGHYSRIGSQFLVLVTHARVTVLKRDGQNVTTDSECRSTSGAWYSVYDGATWTDALDLDIDHMIPLKEAWVSGARNWTTERRRALANDLEHPQLVAVTVRCSFIQCKGYQLRSKLRTMLTAPKETRILHVGCHPCLLTIVYISDRGSKSSTFMGLAWTPMKRPH